MLNTILRNSKKQTGTLEKVRASPILKASLNPPWVYFSKQEAKASRSELKGKAAAASGDASNSGQRRGEATERTQTQGEGEEKMSSDQLLRALSLQEKLAFFYCSYVHEEAVDPETDTDAVRWWEAVAASSSSSARRKGRERVSVLLNHIENTSASNVERLDTTYRAKRELLLIAEGTIRTTPKRTSSQKNLQYQRSARNGLGYGDPEALEQLEHARINNELLMECGALTVFSDHLQRSVHAFRGLNFQHLDLDQVDALIGDLQRDMVLMYLLIVFNANKQNAVFDRQLMVIGICRPTYSLVTILDCLSQLNVLPGFPIKRLLLLFHEWFAAALGGFDSLVALKKLCRARHVSDPSMLDDEVNGRLLCKTFKKTYHDTAVLESQDPYYLQKLKFVKVREAIHMKYLHTPTYELKRTKEIGSLADGAEDRPRTLNYVGEDDPARATAPLDALDDEWELRCEQVYQLFLPCMRDYTTFLSNIVTLSCGSALNARDKKTFYSRRPSCGDQTGPMYTVTSGDYGMGFGGGPDLNNDNQFWKWILREKSIVLDVACLTILLIFKHFRASHACKAEYFMQFFLENNLLATLTKFMNKDVATYLQVSTSRQDAGGDEPKSGFYALERELEKLNLRVEDDVHDYSLQSTRTITSILRILQKLTKRKPNIIKNALCRGSSIVWLKVSSCLHESVHLPVIFVLIATGVLCSVCVACGIAANPVAPPVCTQAGQVTGQVPWAPGTICPARYCHVWPLSLSCLKCPTSFVIVVDAQVHVHRSFDGDLLACAAGAG